MNDEQDIREDPQALQARAFFEQAIESVGRELKGADIQGLDIYPKVELGLAGKGMKSWRALCHLYFGGFEEDAEIVLRSLVEVVADMYFISLDPEKRAQRFRDYEVIHKLRWRRTGDRLPDFLTPDDLQRLIIIDADIKRDVDVVFARQPQWATRQGLPSSWDEDTATKFVKIDQAILYFNFMKGCTQSHPNVVALESYFDWEEGRPTLRVDSMQPKKAHVLADGCQFLHMAIWKLNEVMNLKLDAMLQKGNPIVDRLLLSSRGMLPGQKET
jgi:hypothetical protein